MKLVTLTSRLASGAVVLAMTAGGLAVTGVGAASAAEPAASARAGAAASCTTAKRQVKTAKKNLRKARHAEKNRAAKVRRAKHKLAASKHRREQACATSSQQDVLQSIAAGQLALDQLPLDQLDQVLPPEVADQLNALIAQITGVLDGMGASVPTADLATLQLLLAQLAALDVPGMVNTLEGLLGDLTSLGGGQLDPAALQTVLATLLAGLPGGASLPGGGLGDLGALLGQLQSQLGGLGGLDPADLADQLATFTALLESLSGQVGTSAPGLDVLLDLVDQLSALGQLNPGDAASADALAAVLSGLLGQFGSTDFLGQLSSLLASGGLGDLLDLIGGLLGGLLGGLVPAATA